MKRIMMITLLVLFSVLAASQTKEQIGDTFASLVCQDMDGVVEETRTAENVKYQVIKIPDYYTVELVVIRINSIISGFDDIKVINPWEKKEDNAHNLNMVLAKRVEMTIQYDSKHQMLFIAWIIVGDTYYENL